jgi:DNA polymerase-3 subunit delta'
MRIVVLEDVHSMRREAANSLLKTLEEPPADNLLILTAEASHGMLSTLTSRCQTVPFSALGIDDTVRILMEKGLDTDSAQLMARLSEGSPGKAILLNKKDIISLWKEVLAVVSDSGIDAHRDVGIVLQLGEKMAALKENIIQLFGLLRIWLRDLLMKKTDLTAFLETGDARLKKWNPEQLFARLQAIDQAEKELARNCNRSLVCEVLLFRLQ